MFSPKRVAGCAVVVSALAVGAAAVPSGASASRAAAGYSFRALTGQVRADTAPTVDISGSPAVYVPDAVKGSIVSSKCTKKFSFEVANTTSSPQQMEFLPSQGGGAFGPAIPSGEALGVCATAKIKTQPVFTLESNSAASLTVTIKKKK